MNIDTYADLVIKGVSNTNPNEEVNPEFIEQAYDDGLSIEEAVKSWHDG